MYRAQILRSLCATTFFALAFTATAWCQSDLSTITGTVQDPSNSAVPKATVTVKNEGTGVIRTTATNDAGNYTVSNIPAGSYTVDVEAAGFKKFSRTGNLLDANVPLGVDIKLEVGQNTESITVAAEASRLQTESATLGLTVDERQVRDLMLNGRNPVLLAALKPGVRSSASLANFNFNLTDGGFSMNGSRPNDNVFFYDGAVATRTRSNGTSIGAADVDSTQEVQILTSNYAAEYGRSGGGQVRVITKSGSRDFHGSAYEFFRNNAMDANTWARNNSPLATLNSQPQPLRYNQFGYNLSGPLFIPQKVNKDRNKFFFLFGQEWVRYRTSPANTGVVPSLRMRQGDFGELLTTPNSFFSKPYIVTDSTGTVAYPNNVIPKSAQSVNGMALMSMYPLPVPGFQAGASNWIGPGSEIDNTRKDTISIDFLPTAKDTIRFRALNYEFYVKNAFRGTFPTVAEQLSRPNQTASLNYIHVFGPNVINEFLASASADHVDITLPGDAWDRTKYGVTYPYLYGAAAKDLPNKVPTVAVAGFATFDGGPYPSRSGGPIYNFSDNVTWVKGNHTFKAGVVFERSGQNDRDQVNITGIPGGANNQNGGFTISDSGTTPAIARLALGQFNTYAEIGPRDYTLSRGNMVEFFVQDGWKVTPRLKLELGFRETILQPYHALWGNYDVFDARFYDPAKAVSIDSKGFIVPNSGNIYNGIVIPGSSIPDAGKGRFPNSTDPILQTLFHGLPNTYADTKYNNFVPRVGMAYELDTRTVLRAGGGGFKNRPAVSDGTFLGGNFPFQGYSAVNNGQIDNPLGASSGIPTQFIQTQDPVWKVPTAYNWNVTVQRTLPFDSNLEVSYVGRVGLWLERVRNLNQLPVGTCPNGTCPGGVNYYSLLPYKGFNQIQIAENAARSSYHGLNVAWNRRFTKGLAFGVSYTYSSSHDNASGRKDILYNAYDDRNFWGPSSFDTPHIVVINWIWELPYHNTKGFEGALLGGWQITGITQAQSGTPFSVVTADDFAGIGQQQNQPWQVNGDPTYPKQFGSGGWLAAKDASGNSYFTRPTAGTFSNGSRNRYYGAGFSNWNLGLFKTFQVREKVGLTFRAEAFNWLNHPNWGGANGGAPNSNPTSFAFGTITTKDSRRQMQLSLKLNF